MVDLRTSSYLCHKQYADQERVGLISGSPANKVDCLLPDLPAELAVSLVNSPKLAFKNSSTRMHSMKHTFIALLGQD